MTHNQLYWAAISVRLMTVNQDLGRSASSPGLFGETNDVHGSTPCPAVDSHNLEGSLDLPYVFMRHKYCGYDESTIFFKLYPLP